jgi:hypothetical protein
VRPLKRAIVRLLFVHQNFPGQYKNLLLNLAASEQPEIVFLTQRENAPIDGITKVVYAPGREGTENIHPYIRKTEAGVFNGLARLAARLRT